MGVEVPFTCTGNALQCLPCLESFTVFERHNGLKWLCGACGIQSRRWESLVWGKAECTKNNSESRRVQICKREERMCAFREDYNTVTKEQGAGPRGQHPIAAGWEEVQAMMLICGPVFEFLLPSHLLCLMWKWWQNFSGSVVEGQRFQGLLFMPSVCLMKLLQDLSSQVALLCILKSAVYQLATAYVTHSGAKMSFLKYRNSIYSHFQPCSCSWFASFIFLTTILY